MARSTAAFLLVLLPAQLVPPCCVVPPSVAESSPASHHAAAHEPAHDRAESALAPAVGGPPCDAALVPAPALRERAGAGESIESPAGSGFGSGFASGSSPIRFGSFSTMRGAGAASWSLPPLERRIPLRL
ncbi:MAG TPA: hypothetical protein VM737_03105 [Gemmatimonadota bacterium]|nr:hypothetical protein [Gemmatimonadota bacterium]